VKSRRATAQRRRNRRIRDWRHVNDIHTEIDMKRLPLKQQLAFAVLGTAAAACTLALAVLAPLVA
jgi:hypothetical protein